MPDILSMFGGGLKHLTRSGTKISGQGLSALHEKCTKLEQLDLQWCTDLTVFGLANILIVCGAGLRHLDLSDTNIVELGLSTVQGKFVSLEKLNLPWCTSVTDEGLADILNVCGERLKYLDISGLKISGERFSIFQKKYKNLEVLYLQRCTNLTDHGFYNILDMCGDGLKLCFTHISDVGLSALKETLIKLEELNLSCCSNITDEGLSDIFNVCGERRKHLNISRTITTEERLSELQGKLTNLKKLDLERYWNLTDQGLSKIMKMCCEGLQELNTSETDISTELLSVLHE